MKTLNFQRKVGASGGNGTPHQLKPRKAGAEGHWGGGGAKSGGCIPARLLGEFKKYQQARGFAATTITLNVRQARWFCEWLESEGITSPLEASRQELMRWAQSLLDLPKRRGEGTISTGTQASHLLAVRSFYQFLVRVGYLMADPAAHLPVPRRAKRLPRDVPTEQDIRRMLSAPDAKTPLGYRDRAMIELFYGSGIRSSELRNLRIEDLNLKEEIVAVREGKGMKDRVVPMGPAAAEYVAGYIRNIRPMLTNNPRERTVFLSVNGKRLCVVALKDILDRYLVKSKLEKRITPHSFRHACATHMVRHGADIRYVQEMLGHESLETTQIYVRLEATDLAEAHRKFHPRERL